MISLSKLIQNQTIRKNTSKGFEPIEKVKVNNKNYILGIPFNITHITEKGSDKLKISFSTTAMDWALPHFKVLDKSKYALTTAYDNVMEIKKKIRSTLPQVVGVLELIEKQALKSGFLVKDKLDLTTPIQLSLDDLIEPLTEKEIKGKRKQFNISDFSTNSIEDLQDIIKKQDISIPKTLEEKRGVLVSIVIEIMTKTDSDELSSKEKKEVEKYVKQFTKL